MNSHNWILLPGILEYDPITVLPEGHIPSLASLISLAVILWVQAKAAEQKQAASSRCRTDTISRLFFAGTIVKSTESLYTLALSRSATADSTRALLLPPLPSRAQHLPYRLPQRLQCKRFYQHITKAVAGVVG